MSGTPTIRESLLLGALKRLGPDRRADAEWLADQVAAIVDRVKAIHARSRRPADFNDLGWEEICAWLDDHEKALRELMDATAEAAPAAAFAALQVALKRRLRVQ